MTQLIRIQKVLARAGLGSRRVCDDLVAAKRVKVNGELAILGQRVAVTDTIELDNKIVPINNELEYYLLNKPKGYVCSLSDPHNPDSVIDLMPKTANRVFPVGRLDKDTTGLLIITNDGQLAFNLTHPSKGVWKKYLVEVDSPVSPEHIKVLRSGVELDDGITAQAKVKPLGKSSFYISIHEGKNRQVRRMCEELGYEVKSLSRVAISFLADSTLKLGEHRELTQQEVLKLYS
jgi:23S rRNA pseudouridine2605 synthase